MEMKKYLQNLIGGIALIGAITTGSSALNAETIEDKLNRNFIETTALTGTNTELRNIEDCVDLGGKNCVNKYSFIADEYTHNNDVEPETYTIKETITPNNGKLDKENFCVSIDGIPDDMNSLPGEVRISYDGTTDKKICVNRENDHKLITTKEQNGKIYQTDTLSTNPDNGVMTLTRGEGNNVESITEFYDANGNLTRRVEKGMKGYICNKHSCDGGYGYEIIEEVNAKGRFITMKDDLEGITMNSQYNTKMLKDCSGLTEDQKIEECIGPNDAKEPLVPRTESCAQTVNRMLYSPGVLEY